MKVETPPAEAPASKVIGVMCMVPFFIIYGFFVLTDIPLLVTTVYKNIQELLGFQQTDDYYHDDYDRMESVQSSWSEFSMDVSSEYPIE